ALILEFKAAIKPLADTPKTFPITKADELPAAASQYLRDNGMTFAKGMASVDKEAKKTYQVVATKGTTVYELVFDNAGKLIKSSSTTPPPAPVELKSINELPAAAVAFLTGYTFEKGSVITKEGKKIYSVAVSKDGKRYEITFDADGKVLTNTYTPRTTETSLAGSSDLPGNVREYLTKNYPGWTFVKAVLVKTDTKPTNYNVYVKVGEVTYVVVFAGDGSFVSAKKA
ncbi:MAG: hypothetical protein EOO39_06700, partial [Cytophagaceae bacterium]